MELIFNTNFFRTGRGINQEGGVNIQAGVLFSVSSLYFLQNEIQIEPLQN